MSNQQPPPSEAPDSSASHSVDPQSVSSASAVSNLTAGGRELRASAKQRVGKTVRGKWQLEALLGVGGMAAVYAATHRNGNRAALKMLHVDFARDESIRSRFIREGYVVNRVDHPGRVAIIDDDETEDGAPFLVMELLEGKTLQQALKRDGALPVTEALRIAGDVLDTLVPFHEQRIVHRDLKPGNVFLTDDDQVKLLDFGVAQLREGGEEHTRAGMALGTPSYMAPEQAQGKTDALDGRTDVFAMGAMLYSLLTGKRLWAGKSENESFILAATQPAPSIARIAPDLPIEVIAVVDKALQWDRSRRQQSAAEMRDTLRKLRHEMLAGTAGQGLSPDVIPTLRPERVHPARRGGQASRAPNATPARTATSRPPPPTGGGTTPLSAVQVKGLGQDDGAPGGAREVVRPAIPSLRLGRERDSVPPEADGSKLDEVFRRMDRLLKAIRHYGLSHPEASSRLHGVHEAIITALRADPEGVSWDVQPYCFTREGEPVWEPDPPADVIPYNLYASGLKRVQMAPGVTEEELGTFCQLITLDPSADGGHVDIAGALWDAALTHIPCEITDDLSAFDGTEEEDFWAETDDVEALARDDLAEGGDEQLSQDDANRAAAAAMVLDPMEMLAREDVSEAVAMAMGASGQGTGYASVDDALQLDSATASTLSSDLQLPPERWRERFLDIVMDALADASWRGDEPKLWAPFGVHARRLARTGQFDALLSTYEGLIERLSAYQQGPEFESTLVGLTAEIFCGAVLGPVLKLAAGVDLGQVSLDGEIQITEPLQQRALKTFQTVGALLPALACGDLLEVAEHIPDGDVLDLVLQCLGRHVAGHEAFFGDHLNRLNPRIAHRVLAMLHGAETEAAKAMVEQMRESPNAALRCEATALTAPSHDELKDQLLSMIDGLDVSLRAAAISTMVRHEVRAAGPGLVRAIEDEGFLNRPEDAQQDLLGALHALHPRRAESVLSGIVRQHGLMKDDLLERTRRLAARLLGDWGDTEESLEALNEARSRRWWNSAELREEATKAIAMVTARLRDRRSADREGAS